MSTLTGLPNTVPKTTKFPAVSIMSVANTSYVMCHELIKYTISGFTLVCATNEGLHARVSALQVPVVRFEHVAHHESKPESKVFEVPMVIEDLLTAARNGGFFSYIAGTAGVVMQHEKFRLRQLASADLPAGLHINNHHTTLPMRKGLSSSAAVCVLVATAFDKVYDLGFTQEEIMELAFQVQLMHCTTIATQTSIKSHMYVIQGEMATPSRCGRMDQCVVMGPGAVGLMTFGSDRCSLRRLSLPASTSTPIDITSTPNSNTVTSKPGFYFVVVDLKASKDTVVILRELNDCFPHPSNDTQVTLTPHYYH